MRIPIALKFALLITVLVLAFMAVITVTTVRLAERTQERGVNEGGVALVSMLSAALGSLWTPQSTTLAPERVENLLSAGVRETGGLGILNILVRDAGGAVIATGRREALIYVSREQERLPVRAAAAAGVEVREFLYDNQPIRSFRCPIIGAGGRLRLGEVEVLVSAERIARSRDEMRAEMLRLSALACLAAACGSFVLAALLARPIGVLVRDLRQVGLGRLDHKSRVRSRDELGALAAAFNQMTENLQEAERIRLENRVREHELEVASQIQASLLPAETPRIPGIEIASYYQPAREVGGDYYDYVPIDAQHVGMVVADVVGKGVPGSLIMAMTRSLLRLAARDETSARTTLRRVNESLAADLSPGLFVSLVYWVLHVPSQRLELVRAGHNAPLLYRRRRTAVLQLNPGGIAIGLDRSGELFDRELDAQAIQLEEGDTLLAYSDGVVEAKDACEAEYGIERLARLLRDQAHAGCSPAELVEAIRRDLQEHQGNREPSDDITLLALKSAGTDSGR